MRLLDEMFTEKQAILGDPIKDEVTSTIKSTFGAPSDESIRLETLGEMFDPQHEQEMASIKTRAMLSEFMSSDPVISTYDPDEVSVAYNQIVQLAPRTAQQPVVMRGLMRKLLQQQDALETFDADQITQLEERLKKIEEPSARIVSPYRSVFEGAGA
jgi:hypothetical protein